MTKEIPPLDSLESFLLSAPLYTEYRLASDLEVLSQFASRANRWDRKLDGYCPFCSRDTTFTFTGFRVPSSDDWENIHEKYRFEEVSLSCGRKSNHTVRFTLRLFRMVLQKTGQYPSLADIAIDENRTKYASVLKGENWRELYKAIGLAAHGEGIGSFVYLRRVLERLINERFRDFRAAEGWRDDDFVGLRMDEKVKFLQGHLPSSLVSNRKIYGVFSKGVHELDNDQCLAFFEVGKQSIIFILQDDLKKKEELEARNALQTAIARFAPGGSDEGQTE